MTFTEFTNKLSFIQMKIFVFEFNFDFFLKY